MYKVFRVVLLEIGRGKNISILEDSPWGIRECDVRLFEMHCTVITLYATVLYFNFENIKVTERNDIYFNIKSYLSSSYDHIERMGE